jgi:hypothetical protein
MRSVWSPGGAQDESPGRQPWGAAAPHPALKGRHLAGDANSMGEGRSVPALTGRGFTTDGCVTLRRGSAVFLGTAYGVRSLGAFLGLYRLFHAPLVTQKGFVSKPTDNARLHPFMGVC